MIKRLLGIYQLERRLEEVESELWGLKNKPLFKVGQRVKTLDLGTGTIVKRDARNVDKTYTWVYEVNIGLMTWTIQEYGLKEIMK